MCEIFSKLTIKKPEGLHWLCTGIFIVTFEQILFFALVYLFFEQAYASWLAKFYYQAETDRFKSCHENNLVNLLIDINKDTKTFG